MNSNEIRKVCAAADKALSDGGLRLAICHELIEEAEICVVNTANSLLGRETHLDPMTEDQAAAAYEWVVKHYDFIATTLRVAGQMIMDTLNQLDDGDSVALRGIASGSIDVFAGGEQNAVSKCGSGKSAHP